MIYHVTVFATGEKLDKYEVEADFFSIGSTGSGSYAYFYRDGSDNDLRAARPLAAFGNVSSVISEDALARDDSEGGDENPAGS